MAKAGMNKDSVFNNTEKQKKGRGESGDIERKYTAGPGRPVKHEEPTKKITVVFGESRFVEINEICFEILKNHNKKISMTELIRAITEAVLDSNIDLIEATSEQEINELISVAIEGAHNAIN